MKKRGLKEPSLPKELFPVKLGKEFLEEAKEQETEVVRRKIEKVYLTKFDGSGMSFWQTVFQNCRFEGCDFHKAFFQDVKFVNCSFCHSSFCDANLNPVSLSPARVGAQIFTEAVCTMCSFRTAIWEKRCLTQQDSVLSRDRIPIFKRRGSANAECPTRCGNKSVFVRRTFFKTVLKDQDFTKSSIEGIVLSDERGELEARW